MAGAVQLRWLVWSVTSLLYLVLPTLSANIAMMYYCDEVQDKPPTNVMCRRDGSELAWCYYDNIRYEYSSCAIICNDIRPGGIDEERCNAWCNGYLLKFCQLKLITTTTTFQATTPGTTAKSKATTMSQATPETPTMTTTRKHKTFSTKLSTTTDITTAESATVMSQVSVTAPIPQAAVESESYDIAALPKIVIVCCTVVLVAMAVAIAVPVTLRQRNRNRRREELVEEDMVRLQAMPAVNQERGSATPLQLAHPDDQGPILTRGNRGNRNPLEAEVFDEPSDPAQVESEEETMM